MRRFMWSAFSFATALTVMYLMGRSDGRTAERALKIEAQAASIIAHENALEETILGIQRRYDSLSDQLALSNARNIELQHQADGINHAISEALARNPTWASGTVPFSVSERLRVAADSADSSAGDDDACRTGVSEAAAVYVQENASTTVRGRTR